MTLKDQASAVFMKGKQLSRGCLFCQGVPQLLFETTHFRVLIDTYPIVPGHLLISTKDHYGTAGELPCELQKEFAELREEVKHLALKIAPSVVFYEHGKAGSCHIVSAEEVVCEHFHHHCLPVHGCIHQEIGAQFQGIHVEKTSDFCHLAEKFGSYLFFENSLGIAKMYPAKSEAVPPHFLRTLLCRALNIEELAEWQSYSALDRYIQSVELVCSAYEQEDCHALS